LDLALVEIEDAAAVLDLVVVERRVPTHAQVERQLVGDAPVVLDEGAVDRAAGAEEAREDAVAELRRQAEHEAGVVETAAGEAALVGEAVLEGPERVARIRLQVVGADPTRLAAELERVTIEDDRRDVDQRLAVLEL